MQTFQSSDNYSLSKGKYCLKVLLRISLIYMHLNNRNTSSPCIALSRCKYSLIVQQCFVHFGEERHYIERGIFIFMQTFHLLGNYNIYEGKYRMKVLLRISLIYTDLNNRNGSMQYITLFRYKYSPIVQQCFVHFREEGP